MDTEDLLLDESDVISHLVNGYCASHSANGCTEVSRGVRSPVRMAITVTQIVIDAHLRGQLSVENLRMICTAVGIQPDHHRQESDNLIKKLKLQCKDLQPLLTQTELRNIFGTVEGLGKWPLQQLAVQHQLSLDDDQTGNIDSIRAQIIDHISSGSCQASGSSLCTSFRDEHQNAASSDLEAHVLWFALKKGNISKKALKQILTCKHIQFQDDDSISNLWKLLHSHVTQLRKCKRSEWSQNLHSQEQHEHDKKLEEIHQNWPQPASMEPKENCIWNFHVASSSKSLHQFTCGCWAESVNTSEQKVVSICDINLNLMHNHTDRVFNTNWYILPDPLFIDGPLANILVDFFFR